MANLFFFVVISHFCHAPQYLKDSTNEVYFPPSFAAGPHPSFLLTSKPLGVEGWVSCSCGVQRGKSWNEADGRGRTDQLVVGEP